MTIACAKKRFEIVSRVSAKMKSYMARITNLYNLSGGSEVPDVRKLHINRMIQYVVCTIKSRSIKPAAISRNKEEPKYDMSRKRRNYGITRSTEVPG